MNVLFYSGKCTVKKTLLILFSLALAVALAAPSVMAQSEPVEATADGAMPEGAAPEGETVSQEGVVPADETVPPEARYIPDPPPPPLFNLEAEEGDSPQMLQAKAALRLFKAYNVTVGSLTKCKASTPEAGQALNAFTSRNGSTASAIMAAMRRLGGITPEMKKALDLKIAEEINAASIDCRSLAAEVQAGLRDLYKAEIYMDDYNLMRGRN